MIIERLKKKYEGCLLGAAIGDALGKQNEGLKRSDILDRGHITDYGKAPEGCPGEKLKEGQYTDDTEQMLVLARSLIHCRGFDVQDFAKRIAQWGADALKDETRRGLVGPSSSIATSRLISGVNWEQSGSETPSCGSAMRVAPIGLFYKCLDDVGSNAARSSIPTHKNKASVAGAVAVAIGVRCAIDGMKCGDIIKQSFSRASKYDEVLAKKIELSFELRNEEPDKVFAELGTSYLASDTVPCAFYCFSRYFEDPEKAIIEAVNAGGDTDSIACITGALCGAFHGIYAFPDRWIKGLENREVIEKVAKKIMELSWIM
ncbi:MAG: ADP-ribosylglycohydrolase family protein [Candidatus Methanoperedens sp.]|nr:ADP-ribosylglycohydrolase family protein [Candidatus Methanoperedens sp.]